MNAYSTSVLSRYVGLAPTNTFTRTVSHRGISQHYPLSLLITICQIFIPIYWPSLHYSKRPAIFLYASFGSKITFYVTELT